MSVLYCVLYNDIVIKDLGVSQARDESLLSLTGMQMFFASSFRSGAEREAVTQLTSSERSPSYLRKPG